MERESIQKDNVSEYSEDFEEEEEEPVHAVDITPAAATPQRTRTEPARSTKSHPTPQIKRSGPGWKPKSTRTFSDIKHLPHKGNNLLTPYKSYKQGKSPSGLSPRDRLLSAKVHAIRALQNELAETKRELDEHRKENRLLNRLQVRQERELTKYQSKEGELPQILIQHAEEVRALREQLKRTQEASGGYQRKVNDLRQELQRVSERRKKLEEVVKRRHLLERETLTVQLQEANDSAEEKNRRIAELERGLEIVKRNHAQEEKVMVRRNKALSHEVAELRDYTHKIHRQLKGKEEEMDVMNIYSQRIGKNKHHRAQKLHTLVTENSESQTSLSCPPFKIVSLQTKPRLKTAASQTDLETVKQPAPPAKRLVSTGTQADISGDSKSGSVELASPKVDRTVGKSVTKPQQVSPVLTVRHEQKPTSTLGSEGNVPSTSASTKEGESKKPDNEERQKKDALLARLRAIDGQKGPPSSEPVHSSGSIPTRSSAEPTASVPVGGSDHPTAVAAPPPGKLGGGSSKPAGAVHQLGTKMRVEGPSVTTRQTDIDIEAQRKKQLLLAKLMAIDDGSTAESEGTQPQKPALKQPDATKSSSSLRSWPDIVENMHNGKPAFASEDDPFGSRHSMGKKKLSESAKRGEDSILAAAGEKEVPLQRAKFGRRQQQVAQKQSSQITKGDPQNQTAVRAQAAGGYKPTFGRRAVDAPRKINEPVFGRLNFESEPPVTSNSIDHKQMDSGDTQDKPLRTHDYSWEMRIDVTPKAQNSGVDTSSIIHNAVGGKHVNPAVHGMFDSVETFKGKPRGALLPPRPKAETVVKTFDAMPGAIVSEPDDIEEFVL